MHTVITAAYNRPMIPLVFTVEELLDYFRDYHWGVLSVDDIETAMSRVGRNSSPALVADLHNEIGLEPEVAAAVVPGAWCAAEFPLRQLDTETWLYLFEVAGYTDDGKPAQRPQQVPTLYRGAHPSHRAGWSWTEDRELAQWFADRPFTRGEGVVYAAANVAPSRLLARITQQRRGESEFVVNTRGLTVGEATD